jgi:hypothetical protein
MFFFKTQSQLHSGHAPAIVSRSGTLIESCIEIDTMGVHQMNRRDQVFIRGLNSMPCPEGLDELDTLLFF